MALYENVSAPLTVCFRAVSTPRGIRILTPRHGAPKMKRELWNPHNFCRPSNRSQPHTSTNLSASQICSPTHHSLASFYEGNLHSTQLATGSLKHETGGKTFPPSHRFNSFLHNRNSYRTSSILLQTTNHFVTVAPSPFLPSFCVTLAYFAYPH